MLTVATLGEHEREIEENVHFLLYVLHCYLFYFLPKAYIIKKTWNYILVNRHLKWAMDYVYWAENTIKITIKEKRKEKWCGKE
jgi:hypothetical protein